MLLDIRSNPINMDTEGAMKNVRINKVSILIKQVGFRVKLCIRLAIPGTKQTVCDKERGVCIKWCP